MTTVFSGTTAGAWSFVGNVPTVSPYIQWLSGQLVFTNADTTVAATQVIPQQIQDNAVYDIGFDYNITNGSLQVYYFNNNDLGFRIDVTGSGTYNAQHTIGDATRAAGELSGTFVIRSSSASTDATVDNVIMQQVIGTTNITASFNEDAGGWVSFKSFIPENGVSLSKRYYTMKSGGLWLHNSATANRSEFYGDSLGTGNSLEPSVTTILNAEPSTIKTFNTLNYEGTQSQINAYGSGVGSDGTIIDDAKPYNLIGKSGWYVDYVITDKQEGTLKEFVEKEGKWFNYIRGAVTDIKTSEFSFQGLGRIETIT